MARLWLLTGFMLGTDRALCCTSLRQARMCVVEVLGGSRECVLDSELQHDNVRSHWMISPVGTRKGKAVSVPILFII